MGDRVSVSFKNGLMESPPLFSHWGGMGFVETAKAYVQALRREVAGEETYPLDRLNPYTVMVDFIRFITEGMERVSSDLYIVSDTSEGDNSDNGHHVIEL